MLVKVSTAGVNPLDNMIIRGEVRLIVSYNMPLVMGNEFCGIIEKIGNNVQDFKIGDRVYGRMPLRKIGAFAEYTAIDYTNGNADNAERVIALGVDRFIDYKKENYADILRDVDCVLDTLGERELIAKKYLTAEGMIW